jgi:hypothetical protein
MAITGVLQNWYVLVTEPRLEELAAGVEGAAWGQVKRVGHVSWNGLEALLVRSRQVKAGY